MRTGLSRQRLVALGVAGIVLLTYPILGLPDGMMFGVPTQLLYLFGVWGVLIALAALVAEGRGG